MQSGRDVRAARSFPLDDRHRSLAARLAVAKRAAWETVSRPGRPGGARGVRGQRLSPVAAHLGSCGVPALPRRRQYRRPRGSRHRLGWRDRHGRARFEHEGERGHRAILAGVRRGEREGGMEDALAELRKDRSQSSRSASAPRRAARPGRLAEAPDKFHRDHIGRIAISRLEEEEMRHAARPPAARLRGTTGRAALLGASAAEARARRSRPRSHRSGPTAFSGRSPWRSLRCWRSSRSRPARRAPAARGGVAVSRGGVLPDAAAGAMRRDGGRSGATPPATSPRPRQAFESALAADSTPDRAYNAGNASIE